VIRTLVFGLLSGRPNLLVVLIYSRDKEVIINCLLFVLEVILVVVGIALVPARSDLRIECSDQRDRYGFVNDTWRDQSTTERLLMAPAASLVAIICIENASRCTDQATATDGAGYRHRKLPPIVAVLLRAATVSGDSLTKMAHAQADILFKPPLENVDLLDWQACDRAIDAGYRHAVEKLEELGKG
jgi:hypothetical protein